MMGGYGDVGIRDFTFGLGPSLQELNLVLNDL